MIEKTIQEIADICGGKIVSGDPEVTANEISTDTRTLTGDEVFFAIKGQHFDGTKYVKEAINKGATAIVVQKVVKVKKGVTVIQVKNTIDALQKLATADRLIGNFKTVVITGSSGKTSVKDMVSTILRTKYRVVSTPGNFNNHIGLPISLLSRAYHDQIGVFEVGMSNPGEIDTLAEIAKPDVSIVTNIGTAHIENMGSKEAIAEEKASLLAHTDKEGISIIPTDEEYADLLEARSSTRVIRVGNEGQLVIKEIKDTSHGVSFQITLRKQTVSMHLPYWGHHMAMNAALAVAVGVHFGIRLSDMAYALANLEVAGGRLQRRFVDGVTFLDDSYNANPDSMRVGLETLGRIPLKKNARRIAVLGQMAELGKRAKGEHEVLGQLAKEAGVDILFTVGKDAKHAWKTAEDLEGQSFTNQKQCADYLRKNLQTNDLVLLKGSRVAEMEKVFDYYTEECSS